MSTDDLLVLTSFDRWLLIQQKLFTYNTSYLNEEVYRTESSPSISVSWINYLRHLYTMANGLQS
jgi:hypothetical protein